ncbi:unknown protein [Bathycoccus prasinos]|uniref:Uncharacterized protein n=1 Tax=Bathycoccus prasinos TaxID=41875 RepID=K8ECZ4_9CHLO|nr:unknown protein [Bathycoccus prasinos]CCO15871.1 unknown protein [Bathycoccus prasinos]|eukprot:XP_007514434.1 unknown protein [Bathycoccus prasinos]
MCGACNHGWKPFGTLMKMISNTGAVRDEERTEEKEKARREEEEEEEKEEEKKYEEEEEEEEEEKEKDDDVDDDDDNDVGEILKRKPTTKTTNVRKRTLPKRSEERREGRKKNEEEEEEEEKNNEEEEKNEEEKDDVLKKRKPATKIANQRRKIRRSPVRTTCCFVNADGYSCHKGKADVQARLRVPESEKNKFSENAKCCDTCYRHFNGRTCCFVNADGYSCHKGKADVRATYRVPESEKNKFSENDRCCKSCYRHFKYSNVTCCFVNADGYSCHKGKADVRATYRVPESEKNKFSENAKCCNTCYRHFKYSNVTCCFVNADGYSCHKGKADVRATYRVPESEKNKFSENDRCCKSCYNRLQDAHFFRLKRVCVNCRLLAYDPANTPGAWKLWQVGNDRFLLCSKCCDNSRAQLKRRQNGVPERRKGREAKGDW